MEEGLEFSKFQGTGNDFIIIEDLNKSLALSPQIIVQICDRHFGIGADGVILIQPSSQGNFFMSFYNPDGTQAEICGNGIRCMAKYLYERGLSKQDFIQIETLAGLKTVQLIFKNNEVVKVKVEMGTPSFKPQDVPVLLNVDEVVNFNLNVGEERLKVTCLSIGNPHCVIFAEDIDSLPLKRLGSLIENLSIFPEKTNVEFVQLIKANELKVRVWERGAGETLACGTGACASLAAAVKTRQASSKAVVHLPGGDLEVEWGGNNQIYLTGEAEEIYVGKLNPKYLEKI